MEKDEARQPTTTTTTATQKHSLWGISLILLGTFSAAVMFLLVKLLADVNTFSLVFYRALVQVILSLASLIVGKDDNTTILSSLFGAGGSTTVQVLLVLRAAFGAAAVCAWFYGAQLLPLPDAVTLQFTTPPFAAAFAVVAVGEPWLLIDIIGAVVCVSGVALIAHPTWLFGAAAGEGPDEEGEGESSSVMQQAMAVLVTTLGSALAALAYVTVRAIGDRAPAIVMVLYYGLVSIPVSILGSAVFEGTWDVVRGGRDTFFAPREWLLIVLIGILGHAGQWFLNLGLQRESAATATLATCTQIVWTYIFELAFLHEVLNRWSLLGTALIMGFMLVVAVDKMNKSRDEEGDDDGDASPRIREDEEASEVTPLTKTTGDQ